MTDASGERHHLRRPETQDPTDERIDDLDAALRAVVSELAITHERCLRLEAAFIQLRQDVGAALKRAEATHGA